MHFYEQTPLKNSGSHRLSCCSAQTWKQLNFNMSWPVRCFDMFSQHTTYIWHFLFKCQFMWVFPFCMKILDVTDVSKWVRDTSQGFATNLTKIMMLKGWFTLKKKKVKIMIWRLYSPWCCCKVVWPSFFSQDKIRNLNVSCLSLFI